MTHGSRLCQRSMNSGPRPTIPGCAATWTIPGAAWSMGSTGSPTSSTIVRHLTSSGRTPATPNSNGPSTRSPGGCTSWACVRVTMLHCSCRPAPNMSSLSTLSWPAAPPSSSTIRCTRSASSLPCSAITTPTWPSSGTHRPMCCRSCPTTCVRTPSSAST
ncbi:hypothetical protein SDC9_138252 [bioreactor metagenome]|uniref:Uncharacterized protein n=1 Tax=bioreactor metagenome TaxID=1076179 RepID=A0A645DPA5_9ZZZZ